MFRNRRLCVLAIGLILVTAALARDKPTPADRLKALQQEVADAEAAFRAAWAKLPDPHQEDPAVEKLYQVFRKKQQANFAAAVEMAKADPKSDTGFACLEWLLLTYQAHYLPAAKPALDLLIEHHATNPKIGPGIALLAYVPPTEQDSIHGQAVALLQAVAQKNPDRTARGQAALGLARLAMERFRLAESKASPDTESLADAAEKAFTGIVKDYGECPDLRPNQGKSSATLGDVAGRYLTELRRLRIGQPAPEIEGVDLGGAKFKLSDYRGKVVLLVFWASWCGPCMADVPHEKELVQRFKGRPFVLIGVNGDNTRENGSKAVQKHEIPWQSFWNGERGSANSIAAAWNVRGWPTVYVIDAKGVIRQKYLHRKRLDEPLEKLVAEAEGKKAGAERAAPRADTFEDLAQFNHGGGIVSGTGIRDKGGFTVVSLEAAAGSSKLAVSWAVKEEQRRTLADFRVIVVDAVGKRHHASTESKASAGGNGITVFTFVTEFNLSSDKIASLVIQQRVQEKK